MPIFNFFLSIFSRRREVSRLKSRYLRYRRLAVPGAHVLANVAANYRASDARAQRFWNGISQFDGEVGDATARVEQVRLGEACVGQASRHSRQFPQRSGAVRSPGSSVGSSASVVTMTPRKSHDPTCSLMRQVFLASQPSPAYFAATRSTTGPVST